MFEKIKEAFECYSQSSNKYKDPTLRPLIIKMSPNYLANSIINILKDLRYKTITYNDTFNEIFTSKAGFEVTITLISTPGGSTQINVSVYSPSNKGKTRKALRFLLDRFKKEFNNYITNE